MIGQAAGEAFIFPQQQVARPTQAPMQEDPEQGSPFAVEPPKDRLGYVEGLTSNYYNAYGRMRDYVENMWKDYGLDVTKPDFTQPGGGLLHQAYQGMEAELRMTANDLSEERAIQEEERKAYTEGKVTRGAQYQPGQQLARTLQQEQRVTPTELLPDVLQAVESVSNRVYNTPGEAQRAFATLEPLKKRYEDLKVSDPRNAAFYQRQIDALRMPTYSAPDRTFPTTPRTGEQNYYLTMAKKIANEWKGNWPTVEQTTYNPTLKKQVAVVVPESGLTFGKTTINGKTVDKIPKQYIKDENGAVYAEFTNPDIPLERLDTKTTDEAVTTIFSNNPKYGGERGIGFLNSLRGETGTFDVVDLYDKPQEYEQIRETGKASTQDLLAKQKALSLVREKIRKRMPTSGFWSDKPVSIKSLLADYPEIANKIPNAQIETEGKGYKFNSGYQELTGKKAVSGSIFSEDEIINLISDFVGEAVNLESTSKIGTQTGASKSSNKNW